MKNTNKGDNKITLCCEIVCYISIFLLQNTLSMILDLILSLYIGMLTVRFGLKGSRSSPRTNFYRTDIGPDRIGPSVL